MDQKYNFHLPELVNLFSHELRTPLNAIMGYSALLEKSEHLSPEEQAHLQHISDNGIELLDVINELIELSHIESGNIQLDQQAFDLMKLQESISARFRNKLHRSGIRLLMKEELSRELKIVGDQRKIQTVVNVMINVMLENSHSEEIAIHMDVVRHQSESDRSYLKIQIKDPDSIFSTPMIRRKDGELSVSAKSKSGIGLITCMNLLELMDGSVYSENVGNRSSVIHIQIPVSLNQDKVELPVVNPGEIERKPSSIKALVVDDIPINRTLARIILEMNNIEIIEAVNGQEAVEHFQSLKPDIVLMDISMPVMDGVEAMKAIRQNNDSGAHIPIIAITAGGHTGTRLELIERGFSEYIQKPIKEKELLEKISKFLPSSDMLFPSLSFPMVS